MAIEKATYWLAVGLLALGLHSAYQQGELCGAQRLMERSTIAMQNATERGRSLLVMAEVMLGRNPGDVRGLEAALDQLRERELDASQAQRDVAQAQRDLADINRELEMQRVNLTQLPGHCPESRVVVDLSQVRIPKHVVIPNIKIAPIELGRIPDADFRALEGLQTIQVDDFHSLRGLSRRHGAVRIEVRKSKTAEPI